MRHMMLQLRQVILASVLLGLGACGTPPRPPSVDSAHRHPANAPSAVELQICKSELHNTRMQVIESNRRAESTSATLSYLIARERTLARLQESRPSPSATSPPAPAANTIYTVRFDFGSIRVNLPTQAVQALLDQVRSAPLVILRGRTDGRHESSAESWIASQRATAVRDFLIAGGADPARVRATYQPIGDNVADNATPSGRSLNRRVDIEIYRTLPVSVPASPATP